jgi:hypothetical protein
MDSTPPGARGEEASLARRFFAFELRPSPLSSAGPTLLRLVATGSAVEGSAHNRSVHTVTT